MRTSNNLHTDAGIALILVIFVIALASILVVNLTYSSFLASRQGVQYEQGIKAEYILKSAVNVARVLIKEDKTVEDGPQDVWAKFISGAAVPAELLGITEPNIVVSLEITPEEGRLPIRSLLSSPSAPPDKRWSKSTQCLLTRLGFDEDKEVDHTGLFPQKHFNASELTSNLIDYMDENNDSLKEPDFAPGIEGELPTGTFANERIKRVGELATIPGFSPARLRKLTPFLTVFTNWPRININFAPKVILECLDEDVTSSQVEQIIAFRSGPEGPFSNANLKATLSGIVGDTTYDKISPTITVESKWFQVIAKVDYRTSTYFLRAYVTEGDTENLPKIRSVELF